MKMVTKKKRSPKVADAQPASPPETDRRHLARAALRPSANSAIVVAGFSAQIGVEDSDISLLMDLLSDDIKELWTGDLKRTEAMLFAQAHALQAIFASLARRAQRQEYMKQWEMYLRMALKAQNQCRMTLETLATIKNPPTVFARQANINNGGQQQVNNGSAPVSGPVRADARAPAANSTAAPTELLEVDDGERMDTGAAGAAGRADPHLAPVGEGDRPAER